MRQKELETVERHVLARAREKALRKSLYAKEYDWPSSRLVFLVLDAELGVREVRWPRNATNNKVSVEEWVERWKGKMVREVSMGVAVADAVALCEEVKKDFNYAMDTGARGC